MYQELGLFYYEDIYLPTNKEARGKEGEEWTVWGVHVSVCITIHSRTGETGLFEGGSLGKREQVILYVAEICVFLSVNMC